MSEGEVLIPIVCSLGFFALIGTIWLSAINSARLRAGLEAGIRARMLERSTPPDSRLMRELADAESRLLAREHVLRGVRWSSVLLVLGVAFCALSRVEDAELMTPGLLLIAGGIGFAIATVIALRLCRKWDVLGSVRSSETSLS